MSFIANVVRIMIASPHDCEPEVEEIKSAIHEYNDTNATERKILFIPFRWDKNLRKRSNNVIQDDVDEQLKDIDAALIVFKSRLGGHIGKQYKSKTLAEYEYFDSQNKPYYILRSEMPLDSKILEDNEKLQQLLELRKYLDELTLTGKLISSFNNFDILKSNVKSFLVALSSSFEGEIKRLNTDLNAINSAKAKKTISIKQNVISTSNKISNLDFECNAAITKIGGKIKKKNIEIPELKEMVLRLLESLNELKSDNFNFEIGFELSKFYSALKAYFPNFQIETYGFPKLIDLLSGLFHGTKYCIFKSDELKYSSTPLVGIKNITTRRHYYEVETNPIPQVDSEESYHNFLRLKQQPTILLPSPKDLRNILNLIIRHSGTEIFREELENEILKIFHNKLELTSILNLITNFELMNVTVSNVENGEEDSSQKLLIGSNLVSEILDKLFEFCFITLSHRLKKKPDKEILSKMIYG